MLKSYQHRAYELDGSWDSDDGLLYYWFPYNNFHGGAWALQKIIVKRSVSKHVLEPTMQFNDASDPTVGQNDGAERPNLAVFSGVFLPPSAEDFFRQLDTGAVRAMRMHLSSPDDLYQMHIDSRLQHFGNIIADVFMSSMVQRQSVAESHG
jgi:hypothetical protein